MPDGIARLIGVSILVFALIVFASSGTYVVQPGFRGIAVTLGKVSLRFKPEGFGFKQPFVTRIQQMSVRQQTRPMPAECYSSDLQQVKMEVHVLYRVPERSVVNAWGRSHDVKNLFIVDGSIWVTSGGVNPTSTIQALALYIADSIKQRLATLFD